MSKVDLNKVKARIQALREMTVENGCTEAEAMSAAKKLAELTQQYGLNLTEEDVRQDDSYGTTEVRNGHHAWHEVEMTMAAIEIFCTVRILKSGKHHGKKFLFFGAGEDVENALFLYRLFRRSMEDEWEKERKGGSGDFGGVGKQGRAAFMQGMARRLSDELRKLHKERDMHLRQSKGDLIVLKGQLLVDKFKEAYPRTGVAANTRKNQLDTAMYQKGYEAGGRVDVSGAQGKVDQ